MVQPLSLVELRSPLPSEAVRFYFPVVPERDLMRVRLREGGEWPAIRGLPVGFIPEEREYWVETGVADWAGFPLLTVHIQWLGPEPPIAFSLPPYALGWLSTVEEGFLIGRDLAEPQDWRGVGLPVFWETTLAWFREAVARAFAPEG